MAAMMGPRDPLACNPLWIRRLRRRHCAALRPRSQGWRGAGLV